MAEKTARFVRQLFYHEGWAQNAKLYKLSEPAPVRTLLHPTIDEKSYKTTYVAVSSTPCNRSGKPETMVFLADESGQCNLFNMLTQASFPAESAFTEALKEFGYTLIEDPVINESNH